MEFPDDINTSVGNDDQVAYESLLYNIVPEFPTAIAFDVS